MHRCPSKAVRGDYLETQVWAELEQFLRNPSPVLRRLQAKLETGAKGKKKNVERLRRLEGMRARRAVERTRVIGLYRRGRISETMLDEQMAVIAREEAALQLQIDELRSKITSPDSVRSAISSAETMLAKLRERLDGVVSWECKRELVEVLVAGVRVDTFEQGGVRKNKVTVTYRFSEPGEPVPLVLPQAYTERAVVSKKRHKVPSVSRKPDRRATRTR
jgi:hypothetical protein